MENAQKRNRIFALVCLCALAMSLVDGVLNPNYWVKAAIKLVLFLVLPLAVYYRTNPQELRTLFRFGRSSMVRALVLGGGVYLVIVGGYFALRTVYDFSPIVDQLAAGEGVHAGNFLYVGTYIALVNSLLEEFFFRGFAFLTLRRVMPAGAACCFSAAAFALYHVGMTLGWFSPVLFLLALAGLFAGGCLFNGLDGKDGSLWTSWLVHLCANLAINTVGCILMGIF